MMSSFPYQVPGPVRCQFITNHPAVVRVFTNHSLINALNAHCDYYYSGTYYEMNEE